MKRSKDYLAFGMDTRWNGYRFRSRLEARWAVFFSAMGIEFLYEPQGFRFARGDCYLPDFYLPRVKMFAEVKPEFLDNREMRVARLLAEATGRDVLLLVGAPDFKPYLGVECRDVVENEPGEIFETPYSLDIWWRKKYYFKEGRFYHDPVFPEHNESIRGEVNFSERYVKAVYAARGERFE